MPITIDYSQFITQTGDFPITPSQPYQYSGIYNGVNNLEKNDGIITFTNLPNGLRVASPESATAPFDSIFVDFETFNDYQLLSGTGGRWEDTLQEIIIQYSSGYGLWIVNNLSSRILTGSGNANSSVLDIEFFEPASNLTDYINITSGESTPVYFERFASYIINTPPAVPLIFNEDNANGIWNNAQYNFMGLERGGGGAPLPSFQISGYAITGGPIQSVTIPSVAADDQQFLTVHWSGGSLQTVEGSSLQFSAGIGWNATYANEIMSSYNIISDNLGNSGTASIQLTNIEEFSELIPPLRKLHVLFRRA